MPEEVVLLGWLLKGQLRADEEAGPEHGIEQLEQVLDSTNRRPVINEERKRVAF